MEWIFNKTNKNYSIEEYLIISGNVNNIKAKIHLKQGHKREYIL